MSYFLIILFDLIRRLVKVLAGVDLFRLELFSLFSPATVLKLILDLFVEDWWLFFFTCSLKLCWSMSDLFV